MGSGERVAGKMLKSWFWCLSERERERKVEPTEEHACTKVLGDDIVIFIVCDEHK